VGDPDDLDNLIADLRRQWLAARGDVAERNRLDDLLEAAEERREERDAPEKAAMDAYFAALGPLPTFEELTRAIAETPPEDIHPDDARDGYCYEERCKGTLVKAIMAGLLERGWILSLRGATDRAIAYQVRHPDLPPVPERKPGQKNRQ
jgi:hypothetical protein